MFKSKPNTMIQQQSKFRQAKETICAIFLRLIVHFDIYDCLFKQRAVLLKISKHTKNIDIGIIIKSRAKLYL